MDLARIKGNVAKMASMNAPEADIDGYIASEGVTIEDVRNFNPPSQPATPSATRTALDQSLQGATFGIADEISDRGGAAIASIFTGEKYNDLLKEARGKSKGRMQTEFEQRPGLSIVSNLAGGLLTGGAGTTTKAGTAIANSLRGGNTAARIAKGAAAGAASGGLYGAGTAEEDKRLEAAGKGAIVGAAFGGAIPVAGATLNSLTSGIKNLRTPIKSSDEIKEVAGHFYKLAEEKGGILKPDFSVKFIDNIKKISPQTEAGKIISGNSPFTQIIERMDLLKGKPITLQAAQEIDEGLGDVIDSFVENGRLTKQGKKLFDVQSQFRAMIEDADEKIIEGGKEGFEALKQGRKLWSASQKMADIERIISRAEMSDNPATAIKSGFRTLYNNPNRIRGYSTKEKELIGKAAESGIISDALRTILGSRLIPILTGATGGGLGATAAAQAGSVAARGFASKAQVGRAANIAKEISRNTKLPQTALPSMADLLRQVP